MERVNRWKQIFVEILRLLGRRPAQLPPARGVAPVFDESAADLPDDLQEILRKLSSHKGVVVDTVAHAIRDYAHLRDVMMGPGASADAVDDVTMLAEAQALLRTMIVRAPDVKTLLEIASKRSDDLPGRSSAGEAILMLRDQGRSLHELASAAMQWASSRSEEDGRRLHECAQRLEHQG